MNKQHIFSSFFLGATVTLVLPVIFNNDSVLSREISNNEAICQAEKKQGYAVYTVTRYGQLRGCLRVKQDPENGITHSPILIVKQGAM